ncbi:uncharacterized protein TRIADDRAFT_60876 [Trichoplax adhaerens]|uniref:G-protein coupled receptors family 1 profile domain-containing protein n=1 Tax=Trichoplax adhaerens TaxID=10228 RepID=B3S9E4_TRIAD|nr:hypothetical protein TRIADDRAFT_60876 [Trichoplax adhaerens]EDV20636.1 hypothetical protein TRIADDRAFT_60876 [Trichoplax adhaerens]|eukprot:XP_002116836.1 hypothetical protein TRIADDRAFT_60876 [Trichoplax adhaerens]
MANPIYSPNTPLYSHLYTEASHYKNYDRDEKDYLSLSKNQNTSTNTFQSYNIIAWVTIMVYVWGLIANSLIIMIVLLRKQLHVSSCLQISNFSSTSIIFSFAALCLEITNQIILINLTSPLSASFAASTQAKPGFNFNDNHSLATFRPNGSNLIQNLNDFYFPLCEILTGIVFTSVTAGIYILMMISIQHYQAVRTNHRCLIDIKRLMKITIGIWLVAISLCIPYSLLTVKTYFKTFKSRVCAFNNAEPSRLVIIYSITYALIGLLLPIVVICLCYSFVIFKLCRGMQLRSHMTSSRSQVNSGLESDYDRKSRTGVRLLIVIALVYILCIFPFSTALIWQSVRNYYRSAMSYDHQQCNNCSIISSQLSQYRSETNNNSSVSLGTFFSIAIICLAMLFGLNPIFYLIFNQRLRKEFLKRFTCRFRKTFENSVKY